jgi:putative tricarboxylic transport membrane protein
VTKSRGRLVHGLVVLLVIPLGACGVTRGEDPNDILMIIPNAAGGGYDQTGREAVKIMEANDITGGDITVDNIEGAGGTNAFTDMIGDTGDEHTLITVGLGVVGSLYSNGNELRLTDATPLAQLISEPEGVLVPGDSPFQTIDDLVQAWTEDPSGLAVGGGSSSGGPDHLFPMQLADTLGIDPREVNYVVYDGGGPLKSALLGEKIDVGFSGLAEFTSDIESGELRVLAVSGDERQPQPALQDVPTLTESGIDLVFLNWRGILAPPDISDERRDELIGYLQEMHDTDAWAEQLELYGWTDDFKTGDDFEAFLEEQDERVSTTLEDLGLL